MRTCHKVLLWILIVVILSVFTVYDTNFIDVSSLISGFINICFPKNKVIDQQNRLKQRGVGTGGIKKRQRGSVSDSI